MAINNLSLSGHLVKGFELNKGVAKSSIAINTWDKKTFYVDLVAFKQTAEYIMKGKYQKGELVVIGGELNVNTYNEKKYVQCIVRDIDRIGKANGDDVEIVESGASLGDPKENDVSDEEVATIVKEDEVNIDDEDNLDLPF